MQVIEKTSYLHPCNLNRPIIIKLVHRPNNSFHLTITTLFILTLVQSLKYTYFVR